MPFLSEIYCGPYNEYVEEHRGDQLNGRILYNGTEVATLNYCEDYHWAQLYTTAPELLASLRELVALAEKNLYPQPDKPNSPWGKLLRAKAAIAKAEGNA